MQPGSLAGALPDPAQQRGLAGALPPSELTVLDLADRLLNRGAVLAGEATISVAGVDLIYLGLNVLLSSVASLEQRHQAAASPTPDPGAGQGSAVVTRRDPISPVAHDAAGEPSAVSVDGSRDELARLREGVDHLRGILPDRVDVNPENVEQGLAKLVLTLVELLRQLLERQAIRRMEGGGLTDAEIEQMGVALMRLEEKVRELAAQFGLEPSDLNIRLGPLGDLL